MSDANPTPLLDRIQQRSLIIGGAALLLSIGMAFFSPKQFFQSYLFAYVFWAGIALGSFAISMIHFLAGGRWGAVIRRLLEASIRTFPLIALLFIPVVLGMKSLYLWTHAEEVQASHILMEKEPYLNIPFFLIRAAIYFGIWIFLAWLVTKWSRRQDETGDPSWIGKFAFLGGIGLLLYGLTMTFASFDWMMSLDPLWFSTIYGLLVIAGQVLSAFAFVIVVAALLHRYEPLSEIMTEQQFHDLGNLMLAFVMIWAYLSFSQFLIIWSGNLPEEVPWYLHRTHAGWQWLAVFLVLFHFALPFLMLLSRKNKRNPRILARVAIAVLFMRLVDLYWVMGPEFHHDGLTIHPLDIFLPIGVGGIWIWMFVRQLRAFPLVALNDPNLKEVAEVG